MVTHRVIRIERDEAGQVSFVTKGDANPDEGNEEVPPGGELRDRRRSGSPSAGAGRAGAGDLGEADEVGLSADVCEACRGGIGRRDRYCRHCGARHELPVA